MAFEAVDNEGFHTMDDLMRQELSAIAAAMEKFPKQQAGPSIKSSLNAIAQLLLASNSMTAGGIDEFDQIFKESCEKAELGKTIPALARVHESFVRSVLSSPEEASGLYYSFASFNMLKSEGGMATMPPGSKNWFAAAILLVHPYSRGSSHITSASSLSPGLAIDPKFLSHPLDVEILFRHSQQLEKLLKTEPLASQPIQGGKGLPLTEGLSNLKEARNVLRQTAISSHHYSGTCSMMPQELGGVVNEQLKVYMAARTCESAISASRPLYLGITLRQPFKGLQSMEPTSSSLALISATLV